MPEKQAIFRVFQIGFNRCGTKYLSQLFKLNGYTAKHWDRGAIAEDILVSKILNRKPLTRWSGTTFFGDMECVHLFRGPFIEGYKEYEFLHEHYPDAYFVLNTRDPSAWIASRSKHHGGLYAEFHSHHRGIPIGDVPKQWLADWVSHVNSAKAYFANNPRFIEYNIDEDQPEKLRAHFEPQFQLIRFPKVNKKQLLQRRSATKETLVETKTSCRQSSAEPPHNRQFEYETIEHCLGQFCQIPDPINLRSMSSLYGHWDGYDKVFKKDGSEWGLLAYDTRPSRAFLVSQHEDKIRRLQGVLNDCMSLGRCGELHIDMQDARKFGLATIANPSSKTLTYNRRSCARNTVLWPLPMYHDIGYGNFARTTSPDKICFEDKHDVVGWRGKITGQAGFHSGIPNGRPAHKILRNFLRKELSEEDEVRLVEELSKLSRFEFLLRHYHKANFDLGFILTPEFKALSDPSKLGMYCKPRVEPSWFYRFRYILCLSGHDTASNFFVAANSNSVVLKEEDGWELYYTHAFRPWEHYIPIKVGGADVEEKLDWARSHTKECDEMRKARQKVCADLADRHLRNRILNGILDGVWDGADWKSPLRTLA